MNRFLLTGLGIASLLTVATSCSNFDESVLSPAAQGSELHIADRSSIASAQNWFLSKTQRTTSASRTTEPSKKVIASNAPSYRWSSLLDWDKAQEANRGQNQFMLVPMRNAYPTQFASIALKGTRRMIIWQDKKGNRQSNIVELYTVGEIQSEEYLQSIFAEIARKLPTGKLLKLKNFNGNVIVYTEGYQFPSGSVYRNGLPAGRYSLSVNSVKPNVTGKRFQSTMARSTTCNGTDGGETCTSYCGTVSSGGYTSPDQCYQECEPNPQTPGGDLGDGGPGGYYGGDPNDPSTGTVPPGSTGDLGEVAGVQQVPYGPGQLKLLIEASPTTNTINKVVPFYVGPGGTIQPLGEGVAIWQEATQTYFVEVHYQFNAADIYQSREGKIEATVQAVADYYAPSGYKLIIAMKVIE